MSRRLGYLWMLVAVLTSIAAGAVAALAEPRTVWGLSVEVLAVKALLGVAVLAATYGLYVLVLGMLAGHASSKRRQHDLRNVLRLALGAVAIVGLLGVVTQQWVGVLFSLGVVGFAVTFALQQPLFSLIGWIYVVVNRPYRVGDRIAIEGSKGDVVDVGLLVTTLWEIDGELVSSNQPSGRIITLPNSVVLSSHVKNYTREEFPYVWNELSIQVAYETDLAFASETMRSIADDLLGDEMERNVERYRERLAETPVDLEVRDRPTVNVVQAESWVELKVRYLVDPRRGQRTKNQLHRAVLAEFNASPDRVKFPVGRNR